MNSLTSPPESGARLLTVAEFAFAIGKTERQVYRYLRQGRVHAAPPAETGKGGVRIPESEVQTFIDNLTSASSAWARMRASAEREIPSAEILESVEELGSAPGEGSPSPNGKTYQVHAEPQFTPLQQAVDSVPLERHEAAVMRLGYMQSQLEQVQRLLTAGSAKEKEQEEKVKNLTQELEEAQREILRLGAKYEVAKDSRQEAELRAQTLAARLEEAERRAALPWWKRIFN